jgi:hypothetical protein
VFDGVGIVASSQVMKVRNLTAYKSHVLAIAALFVAGLWVSTAWAQTDAPPVPLGDLAKKTRTEKTSKNHITARRVLNDENAPSANLVEYKKSYWATIPAAELTVKIPTAHRAADFGVEVPLEHSGVYIAFGETIWDTSFDGAAQEYLSMLLTRSRFRGAALKLAEVEDTSVGSQRALLVHFNFGFHGIPHEGIALFISAPEQVVSLGCMYRNADWEKASPICEQVMNSAEVSIPADYKPFKKPFQ